MFAPALFLPPAVTRRQLDAAPGTPRLDHNGLMNHCGPRAAMSGQGRHRKAEQDNAQKNGQASLPVPIPEHRTILSLLVNNRDFIF
uniref:Uncharacterized protein n=1 Tax=Desulfobacca acetoxidans TaxID=60893 RepID=A0A7C5EL65_9BACT